MTEFITSSELEFGDVVANFCDPDFLNKGWYGDPENPSTQVYRMVAYSLFAKRLIVPSRYLLQPSINFSAFESLEGLLEEGILVPDLREGYTSFRDYLAECGVDDPARLACAQFLDDHASVVYSFDITGQSELYHQRLLEDIQPGGKLRTRLDPGGCYDQNFERIFETFSLCEGSRRIFTQVATSELGCYQENFAKWAALRYYTTPAEMEPRSLRDFPLAVSNDLRLSGLSVPVSLVNPEDCAKMPEPMSLAHRVLVALPPRVSREELRAFSSIVLSVRRQVPGGSAKFATLSEKGFKENLEEVNEVFHDALAQEKKFSRLTHSTIVSTIMGSVPTLAIWWSTGVSLDPLTGVFAGIGIDKVTKIMQKNIGTKVAPFLETASHLELEAGKNMSKADQELFQENLRPCW